jgi:hypothetical protein
LHADNVVDTDALRVLKQLGIDAAVKALMTAQTSEISAAQRQLELALRKDLVFRNSET